LCGDTINVPVVMLGHLNCGTPTAVTIGPGGSLDMAGYSITCLVPGSEGVRIEGSGATLSHGTISDCDVNVTVAGSGGHTVSRIQSLNATVDAFQNEPTSEKNVFLENLARAAGDDCFDFNGPKHAITRNVADTCGGRGIRAGDTAKLKDNVVSAAAGVGIDCGEKGSLTRNFVDGGGTSGVTGISTGASSKLTSNVVTGVLGNGFELAQGSKATKNRAAANFSHGFYFYGPGTKLTKNRAVANVADGFFLASGDEVELKKNNASTNNGDGIDLPAGSGHKLTGNVSIGNVESGLEFGGTASKISKNFATANGTPDIQDLSANCGTNVWSGNTFGSNTQPCEQ